MPAEVDALRPKKRRKTRNIRTGERMREIRERKRISLAQLADAVGVTKQAISFLEKGLGAGRLVTLRAIARELGVTVEDITG